MEGTERLEGKKRKSIGKECRRLRLVKRKKISVGCLIAYARGQRCMVFSTVQQLFTSQIKHTKHRCCNVFDREADQAGKWISKNASKQEA